MQTRGEFDRFVVPFIHQNFTHTPLSYWLVSSPLVSSQTCLWGVYKLEGAMVFRVDSAPRSPPPPQGSGRGSGGSTGQPRGVAHPQVGGEGGVVGGEEVGGVLAEEEDLEVLPRPRLRPGGTAVRDGGGCEGWAHSQRPSTPQLRHTHPLTDRSGRRPLWPWRWAAYAHPPIKNGEPRGGVRLNKHVI